MAAAVRKKQDDRHLKALRELGSLGANRECFDCGQRGPTYINMTIGSFVCSQCSGVLRGLTPPHRVKSISMATFTQEELDFIKAHGNEECSKTWLGLLSDPKARGGQPQQDYREHIIDKYEKQRYFLQPASPLKSIGAANGVANGIRNGSSSISSSSPTSPSSPSSSSVNSASAADQNNNNNINIVQQQNQLNLKAIQLTPPASTRTSGRHHHQLNNNHNNNINSRGINGSSAFAEDSLFSEASTNQQVLQQPWANLNSNSSGSLFATINSNGGVNNNNNNINYQGSGPGAGLTMAPGQQKQQHQQHQLTNGGDFVADFGSADIFNANVINGGGAALKRTNAAKRMNGGASPGGKKQDENFADFDHNPIFNAAEYNLEQQQQRVQQQHQQYEQELQKYSQSTQATIMRPTNGADGNNVVTTSQYSCNNSHPNYHHFCPNLHMYGDCMESHRVWAQGANVGGGAGNTTIPFNYNNPGAAAAPAFVEGGQPIYSNFWQPPQYQQSWKGSCYQIQGSPFISAAEQIQCSKQMQLNLNSNHNRWSVPMSMSSSNSSMASTPSADRYAALKDLDEQIREIKEKEITVQIPPQPAVVHNPNPFKTSFSPSAAPVTTTNYSTPPTNPFKTETNGFSFAQPQFQPVHFNGFAPTPAINGFQNGGNIFGIGLNATGGGQKSNNPFL